MKKKSKTRLFSGFMFLFLLPFFGQLYFFPSIKNERILPLFFASRYVPDEAFRFDTTFLSNDATKRNYLKIELDGKDDLQKVLLFKDKLRRINLSHDTLNGIQLTFLNEATFGTFISCINWCKKEKQRIIVPFENNVWIFHTNLTQEKQNRNEQFINETNLSNEKKLQKRIDQTMYHSYFQLIFGSVGIYYLCFFATLFLHQKTKIYRRLIRFS